MGFNFNWISGVSVGFELIDRENMDIPSVAWGVAIDVFIFRIILMFPESGGFSF